MYRSSYHLNIAEGKSPFPRRLALVLFITIAVYFISSTSHHLQKTASQLLLGKAFHATLNEGKRVKPWFWSESWPIVALSFPAQQKRLYVLAGSQPDVLKHGPGHVTQSAFPGQMGNAVIVSDTNGYLDFMSGLKTNTLIEVQSPHGNQLFQIEAIRVTADNPQTLSSDNLDKQLTLITPYKSSGDTDSELYLAVIAKAVKGY